MRRWDGTRWISATTRGMGSVAPSAASVTDDDAMVVVSYYGESLLTGRPGRWHQYRVPTGGHGRDTEIDDVTIRDVHDEWAVGTSHVRDQVPDRPTNQYVPTVLHGDGGTWRAVSAPSGHYELKDVVSLSEGDAWAGGDIFSPAVKGGTATWQPVLLHWDGSRWSRAQFPVAAGSIIGLTANGPRDVWAVVASNPDVPSKQSVLAHWNGSAWTVLRVPGGRGVDAAVADCTGLWVAGSVQVRPNNWSAYLGYLDGDGHWSFRNTDAMATMAKQPGAEDTQVSVSHLVAVPGARSLWLVEQTSYGSQRLADSGDDSAWTQGAALQRFS